MSEAPTAILGGGVQRDAPRDHANGADPSYYPGAGPNRLFLVLDLYWRSPESSDLWYTSRRFGKGDLNHLSGADPSHYPGALFLLLYSRYRS